MKNTWKRLAAFMLAAGMAAGFAGCAGGGDSSADGSPDGSGSSGSAKYTIGYVSASFADDYCHRLANAFEACSNDEIEVKALDGNLDPAKMISCIETFKTQGVDALIVQPLGNVPDACTWANEEGVPLIFTNIQPILSDTTTDLKYYYIGSSEEKIGAQEAEALASGLDEGAKVCLLMLPLGQDNQIRRTKGFEDWMAENRPDIEIIDEQATRDNDGAQAMSICEDWIQRFGIDGIDAIAHQSNNVAQGIIETLKSHDAIGKIKIAGIGCPPGDGFDWIANGEVYCDLYQNPMLEAKASVEVALKMLKGQDGQIGADENNTIWVDMVTVTADNVEQVREEAKY